MVGVFVMVTGVAWPGITLTADTGPATLKSSMVMVLLAGNQYSSSGIGPRGSLC